MDNTRKLTGNDVPKEVIESIEPMINELADALVRDYNKALIKNRRMITETDIDKITSYVIDSVGISISINLKVNPKMLDEIGITVIGIDQKRLE